MHKVSILKLNDLFIPFHKFFFLSFFLPVIKAENLIKLFHSFDLSSSTRNHNPRRKFNARTETWVIIAIMLVKEKTLHGAFVNMALRFLDDSSVYAFKLHLIELHLKDFFSFFPTEKSFFFIRAIFHPILIDATETKIFVKLNNVFQCTQRQTAKKTKKFNYENYLFKASDASCNALLTRKSCFVLFLRPEAVYASLFLYRRVWFKFKFVGIYGKLLRGRWNAHLAERLENEHFFIKWIYGRSGPF